MADFLKEARLSIEKNFDAIIKDPRLSEEKFSAILRIQGIEPNLEALLSFISGMLFGTTDAMYVIMKNRHMNYEEVIEFNKLLKRRAWEMRQAFIGTRIG